MSDVYRYEFDENGVCYRKPDGPFVSHEDYARLQAEVQTLRHQAVHDVSQLGEQSAEIAHLKAEVERLRNAGDEILNGWQSNSGADVERFTKACWLWITAKEGETK